MLIRRGGANAAPVLLPKTLRFARAVPAILGSGPTTTSLDVTNRCNLSCTHCYYYAKPYEQDNLTDDEWVAFVRDHLLREHPSIKMATYVGGEPMLRSGLIERLRRHFLFNWVVTNGTRPVPRWPWATFAFSVDGDREDHDRIRGEGMFARTLENIAGSDNLNFVHTTITTLNLDGLGRMVEALSALPVRGVRFSAYTPMEGAADPMLPQRGAVYGAIRRLKSEYGGFVLHPDDEIEHFRTGVAWGENCSLRYRMPSYSSKGELKEKCVMGPGTDCARCGCTVPSYLYSLEKDRSAAMARVLWGLLA